MAIDRRIIKTRNSIKQAYMQLMLDHEMNELTISDIAEKAAINRSTFYLHYTSLNDVMNDIENELAEKIQTIVNRFDIKNFQESLKIFFGTLLNVLNANDTLRKYMFYSTNSQTVTLRMKKVFADTIIDAIRTSDKIKYTPKMLYPAVFATSGLVDMFIVWFNQENRSCSLEDICDNICKKISIIFHDDYDNQN